jgi:hypothetical protein
LAFLLVPAACGAGGDRTTRDQTTTFDSGIVVQTTDNGCITIELTPAASTCSNDQDCVYADGFRNPVCSGEVTCCQTEVVNLQAAADLHEVVSPLLKPGDCPCIASGVELRCVAGTCAGVPRVPPHVDAGL